MRLASCLSRAEDVADGGGAQALSKLIAKRASGKQLAESKELNFIGLNTS